MFESRGAGVAGKGVSAFVAGGERVWDSLRRFSVYRRSDQWLCIDWLLPAAAFVVPESVGARDMIARGMLPSPLLGRFIPPVMATDPCVIAARPRHAEDDDFWQYPCATEWQALENHLGMADGAHCDQDDRTIHTYLGLPWATYIDRGRRPEKVLSWLRPRIMGFHRLAAGQGYRLAVHTICQHVAWRRFVPCFREFGVTDLHLSHCERGSGRGLAGLGLRVHSWPLIAVNVEDASRSMGLRRARPGADRRYLASFIGAHMPHYRSDVRLRLLEAARRDGSDDVLVEVGREWHFEKTVAQEQVANRPLTPQELAAETDANRRYNEVLSDSVFSLCPEGAGPNTLRLWESLAVGAIPVVLSDHWTPPTLAEQGVGWSDCCLFIPTDRVESLFPFLRSISQERIEAMSAACLMVYAQMRARRAFASVGGGMRRGSGEHRALERRTWDVNDPYSVAERTQPEVAGPDPVMGWRPLVSVVMPSLDQGRFIESAVLSVLGQGSRDVELIVADGGSQDGTLELLRQLAQGFGSRLSWASEQDAGPANAVNKAIGRARGEIIGWLNSDDCYAPDAIALAVDFFAANPSMVMVYGEGEHIDVRGRPLGHYPTRPPTATLAGFQSGCFICQPTVFLRRAALDEVGLLDEGLFTAFDFDLWLRMFQRFPDRIGFIDRVLAYSRLHADCITLKQRRQVATEAVHLLARYLGHAEDHWVRTYLNELLEVYPFGDFSDHLQDHVSELVRELEDGLGHEAAQRLRDDLSRDARLQLARPGVYAHVYPDGWAPRVLEVRVAGRSPDWGLLCLECDHAWPIATPLDLHLSGSWGWESRIRIEARGPFELEVPLDGAPCGQGLTLSITTDPVYVPNQCPDGGDDGRGLAFLVRRLRMTDVSLCTQATKPS